MSKTCCRATANRYKEGRAKGRPGRKILRTSLVASLGSIAAQLFFMLPVWRRWPRILLRDSRMAAAVPLGPRALAPEVSSLQAFAWATAVHVLVALSDALVVSLLAKVRLLKKGIRLAPFTVGALYGLAAYGFRLYVLTPLFYPWFCKLRTPAYLLTHIAHGVLTALAWKRSKRGSTISQCAMIF